MNLLDWSDCGINDSDLGVVQEAIAQSLHSIQAQTIRDAVDCIRKSPIYDTSEIKTTNRHIESLLSYAKDKGIEIE